MSRRLMLFAKRPRLGQVKTRLATSIGAESALRLYRAFLHDLLDRLRGWAAEGRGRAELWLDGPPLPGELEPGGLDRVHLREQGPGDLGTRLTRAFESSAGGGGPVVVIGADAPTLPRRLPDDAFRALEHGAGAVLAPATDGGYVLLGLARPEPELFRGVPWGGPDVAATTRRSAARLGLELAELPAWYDVDDASGLARLREELARGGEGPALAPRTDACVRALGAERRPEASGPD